MMVFSIAVLTFSCAKDTAKEKPFSPAEIAANPPGDGPICGVTKSWGKKPGESWCTCYAYEPKVGSTSGECEWVVVDNSVCESAGLPNYCGQ